jgi:hypothetical protein
MDKPIKVTVTFYHDLYFHTQGSMRQYYDYAILKL